MRLTLRRNLMLLFGIACCGGGVGGDQCPPVFGAVALCINTDAEPRPPACDLPTGFPCEPGKCALVSEGDADPLIGCAPLLGSEVGLGEACEQIMDIGRFFDNCAPTLHCRNAVCVQICDLDSPTCPRGLTCTSEPDLFLERGKVWAGFCD
jgi:hypothetical protein